MCSSVSSPMSAKLVLPLLAVLLTAACATYEPSVRQVTMLAGDTTTMTVTEYHNDPEFGNWVTGTTVISSDPSILQVVQELPSTTVTLIALGPGEAFLMVNGGQVLVTVDIGACNPVSLRVQVTPVEAQVGYPVELRVITNDPQVVPAWYEERNGAWSPYPTATGDVYVFNPKASGTFRFLVAYGDTCNDVSTTITVIASTRARAVRH